MKNKNSSYGFTLIELLVVFGILAILFSIVLAAVNPSEQFHETADVSDKTVVDDFIKANVAYLASANAMPWQKNTNCNIELATGGTLASMPDCIHELVQGGKLESTELQSQQAKDIYISKCGNTAVVCYNPKSKQENEDAGTKYDKYGNINPSCPLTTGISLDCYVCRPILNSSDCTMNATPTPSPVIPTSTPTPLPTATPTPTSIPTPAPTATPAAPSPTPLYGIGGYKLDDTKMLRTYAILAFDYPYFPPNYMVDISDRPDFGGTTSSGFGYFVNGVPVTSDADTIFNVWYAGDGNMGGPTSTSYLAERSFTSKHFTFVSMPYYWSKYVNGCGKTFYYIVVGWPGDSTGLIGQTYSAVIDCTTIVGVWPGVYWPPIDLNGDGTIDWTDYVIGALQTRIRAGGWQPPE